MLNNIPPRIYLAGPEVFHPNAIELGAEKCRLCAEVGLEGVFPLDAELEISGLEKHEQARRIALANEALIRSSDAMIANLTPFRGASMDAGTAFEVGFMRALLRPVFGYTNSHQLYFHRSSVFRDTPHFAFDCDRAENQIEDFDQAENLMISVAVTETAETLIRPHSENETAPLDDLGTFHLCLQQAARQLVNCDNC